MKLSERLKKKLKMSRGESIAETLIALLISSAGLMMLAYMITAGGKLVTGSRTRMSEYYEKNNIIAEQKGEAEGTLSVTITDKNLTTPLSQTFTVDYFENDTQKKIPVISYRMKDPGTNTGTGTGTNTGIGGDLP